MCKDLTRFKQVYYGLTGPLSFKYDNINNLRSMEAEPMEKKLISIADIPQFVPPVAHIAPIAAPKETALINKNEGGKTVLPKKPKNKTVVFAKKPKTTGPKK